MKLKQIVSELLRRNECSNKDNSLIITDDDRFIRISYWWPDRSCQDRTIIEHKLVFDYKTYELIRLLVATVDSFSVKYYVKSVEITVSKNSIYGKKYKL
jgi:hypothetical protein